MQKHNSMNRLTAIVVLVAMLLSTACISGMSFAESKTTVVVEKGSDWQYLVYEDSAAAAPEGWTTGADSETWETAPAPFSGSSYTNASAVTVFPYGSFKSFIRQEFTITEEVKDAKLSIKYDEDPVVYINGKEVWAASGYHDSDYVTVSLYNFVDAFQLGTNTIAVEWGNAPTGYGSVMDLGLEVTTGEVELINPDGTVALRSTDSYNSDGLPATNPFGDIGSVNNLYDGNLNSVWGWGEVGIYVIANFIGETMVSEITLTPKNEGSMTNNPDPHGLYNVQALVDGEWVEIGNVEALIEGASIDVNKKATAIKVSIPEWYNDNWVSIAELVIKSDAVVEEPQPETVEFDIFPYSSGMENWVNSPNKGDEEAATQILICPKYADGSKAAELYAADLDWTITLVGSDGSKQTVVLKHATQYDGGTWGILRFEPCLAEADNRFVPVAGVKYTVSATVEVNGTTYVGASEEGAFSIDVDPIVPGAAPDVPVEPTPEPEGPVEFVIDIYGTGMENWSDQTQILVCPKDADGNKIADLYATDIEWTFTIIGSDGSKQRVVLYQSSQYDGGTWGIVRFQPCVEDKDNRFVPVVGVNYTISATVTANGVDYVGSSAEGAFSIGVEPIVPDDVVEPEPEPTPDVPVEPTPEPEGPVEFVIDIFGTGMENWSEQTQILVCPKDADGNKIADLYATDIEWTFTIIGSDGSKQRVVLYQSSQYDGGSWGIVRFQPCVEDKDNRFVPVVGVNYTISATVTANGVDYVGTSAEGAFSIGVEPIVPDDVVEPEPEPTPDVPVEPTPEPEDVEFVIFPYGSGMENWTGSPNKGDAEAATQLLICPKFADGTKVAELYAADLEWTITLVGSDGSKQTVVLKYATQYDGGTWGILRFEPCLAEADNRFVPVVGVNYTVYATVEVNGTTYVGASEEGAFSIGVEPIVPDDVVEPEPEPTPDVPVEPTPEPEGPVEFVIDIFGTGMENWSDQTQILVCPKDADGNKIADLYATDIEWTFTITGSDGSKQRVVLYQSSQYDGGTWGIVRFQPCVEDKDNRFVPVVGVNYTISATVTANGIDYVGTSAEGAFSIGVEPIVPGDVVEPEPEPTPDVPVEPTPEPEGPVEFVIDIYGTGMENWSEQTQILVCPKDADGNKIADLYATDIEWTFTITGSDGSKQTVVLYQSSQYDGGTWGIIRFQPCVEDKDNRFVPVVGVNYTISATVTANGVDYVGTSAEGAFSIGVEPIVPDDEPEYGFITDENGETKYFYEDGTFAIGFAVIDGKTYRFSAEGVLFEGETLTIGTTVYYFTPEHTLIEGLYTSDEGTAYYVGGIRQTGWIDVDGDGDVDTYFIYSTGLRCEEDRELTIDGVRKLFKYDATTGFMVAVEGLIDNKFYVDGVCQTGWVDTNGDDVVDTYFFTDTGLRCEETRELTLNGVRKVYTFDSATGFTVVAEGLIGNKFYVDGAAASGWIEIDGKTFYFKSSELYTESVMVLGNCTYYFGADNALLNGLVTDDEGTRFYVNGIRYIGWVDTDEDGNDDSYFYASTGLRCEESRELTYNETRKYFIYDAATGFMTAANGFVGDKYYVDGVSAIGWTEIDGKTYYFTTTTGELYTSATLTQGDNVYYFGADNARLEGLVTDGEGTRFYIEGKRQYGWADTNGDGTADSYFYSSTALRCEEDRTLNDGTGARKFYIYDEATGFMTAANGIYDDGNGKLFYVDGCTTFGWVSVEGQLITGVDSKTISNAYYFAYSNNYYMITDTYKTIGGVLREFDKNNLVLPL